MSKGFSDVLFKPVITEKSSVLSKSNKYTFKVARHATKSSIKSAFEAIFKGRKVLSIKTLKIKGHLKRTKTGFKYPIDSKKAIVTIEGPRIDYFPEVT